MTESDFQNELTTALKDQERDFKIQKLEEKLLNLEKHVVALEEERKSFMKWGITALGAAVLGMGLYIYTLLSTGKIK